MLPLPLAQAIILSVITLSMGLLLQPPLLPLDQAIITKTLTFGVDMVGSTRRGRGADVWR